MPAVFSRGKLPPAPSDIEAWGNPLRVAPSQGRVASVAAVPPFWQFKPQGGIDLAGFDTDTLAAGIGSTVLLTPDPSWTIIPSYNGVLASLIVGVTAPLTTMDIFFTLLANGSPVPGWTRITPPAFAANGILLPVTGPLQLPQNTTLTVRVTNNAATGPWVVQATAAGWMWPHALEQQTFGALGG